MAVKYKDLTKYSATIGAVMIGGVSLQLCDYVEARGAEWFAMAYLPEGVNVDMVTAMGIQTRTLPAFDSHQAMSLAYVPQGMLGDARPKFDDEGQTEMLIDRLQNELLKLNSVTKARVA
jgi:hypothetical protein